MDTQEFETKKLEYQMAQEMLRHYDALNWQIGSIFIAAVLILTGFAVNKDIIDLAKKSQGFRWTWTIGIPFLSWFVLYTWFLWFRRHRSLYNVRNEVLHRLEMQLGMYHFLRIAEVANGKASVDPQLSKAKIDAGHDADAFKPLYSVAIERPSGYTLAKVLAFGIPCAQFILLCLLYRFYKV